MVMYSMVYTQYACNCHIWLGRDGPEMVNLITFFITLMDDGPEIIHFKKCSCMVPKECFLMKHLTVLLKATAPLSLTVNFSRDTVKSMCHCL